jgi:hypothetical protein
MLFPNSSYIGQLSLFSVWVTEKHKTNYLSFLHHICQYWFWFSKKYCVTVENNISLQHIISEEQDKH